MGQAKDNELKKAKRSRRAKTEDNKQACVPLCLNLFKVSPQRQRRAKKKRRKFMLEKSTKEEHTTTTPLKGEEKSERRDRCVYKKTKKKTLPTHERE